MSRCLRDLVVIKLLLSLCIHPKHTSFILNNKFILMMKFDTIENAQIFLNSLKSVVSQYYSYLFIFFFHQVSLSQNGWEITILGSRQKYMKLLWSSLSEGPNYVKMHCRIKLNQSVHFNCISVTIVFGGWIFSRLCIIQNMVTCLKFT